MPALELPTMAKRGRKPTGKTDPTVMIRVKSETAELVALVARAQGITAAELLERVLRPPLLERYATVYPHLVTLVAEDAAGGNAPPPLPNPLLPHPETGELVRVSDLHPPARKPKG